MTPYTPDVEANADQMRAAPDDAAEDRLRRSVKLGPETTGIPNRAIDLIFPKLKPSQQACMLYIVRRTLGFASPTAHGERKRWDRIALSQFIDGNRSAGYVLDLGTGLSRNSVLAALGELEEMELVWVSYECPTEITKKGHLRGCGWSEAEDDFGQAPQVDERTKAVKCPRCGRTASKAYALRTLTPGFIKRFLTKMDGRPWEFDPQVGHFYIRDESQSAPDQPGEQLPDPAQLRAQLFFPDKMDRIISDAVSQLKSGKMAERRLITGFLQPTLALQEEFGRNAARYALDIIIEKGIAAQSHNRNWIGYARACAKTYTEKKHGSIEKAQQAISAASVESELERCAQLNSAGEHAHAKQLLSELLGSRLDSVAEEFGGDRALARRHLLESFKRGFEDYRSIRDYTIATDFLPEWSWEQDEVNHVDVTLMPNARQPAR